jgi:glycine/D-amino acid oxidase-like deaminating enzyme
MTATFDICIVGAGLAGSALASNLAAAGLRIALIEAGVCPGRGASAYSGGIVRAFDEDRVQAELALQGVRDWLGTAFPVDPVRRCGVFNVIGAESADRAAELIRDISAPDYPIELLGQAAARAVAPGLNLASDREVVIYEPLGGTVDVKLAARLMLSAARGSGAVVLEHATVERMRKIDRGVRLEARDFALECTVAVIAAGPWSSRWLGKSALVVKRIQLSIARAPGIEHCVVDQRRGGYAVPGSAGIVAAGSFDPPAVADPDQPGPPCAARRSQHLALLEQLTGSTAEPLGELVGLDAYTPDLLPRTGFDDADRAIYAFTGCSGRGAKYLPWLAKQAAGELIEAFG